MIVETGQQEPGANSYITVEFADTYHGTFGNTDWSGTTEEKEKALVIACQSLDLLYASKFLSHMLSGEQSLLFPRYPFVDRNGIIRAKQDVPIEVKRAQAELALMYINGVNLFPEGNDSGRVASESVKIGDIETSTTYKNSPQVEAAQYEGFRKVDLLLWGITKGRQPVVRMAR